MSAPAKPCRICGVRPRVETRTDLYGRASYTLTPCRHEQRIAAGCCADCGLAHGGDRRRRRCDPCRDAYTAEKRREKRRRWLKTPAGRAWVKRRNARPEVKARNIRYTQAARARMTDEERAAYRERQRAWHLRTQGTFGAPRYQEHLARARRYHQEHREARLQKMREYRERKRDERRAA